MLKPHKSHRPINLRQAGFISFEFLLLVILLVLIGVFINKRQTFGDWLRLRGYNPPSAIVQLANEDTMNAYTRHLFYLNRPQLLSTVVSFRHDCPENEDVVVLGCYHTGQNGIFIYNVPDPTLAGVQEVTAAHEVLHSVYARLSSTQRKTLDSELESFYQHGLNDSQVADEVKLYQQTEPTAVYDEMSCTFGTEVANLPADLNAYYAKYFNNRMAIVDYEQGYQGQLVSRQNTINQDDSTLSSMLKQINSDQAQINAIQASLNSQQTALASEATTNVSAYNAAVPTYNQQVDVYNDLVNSTKALIDEYNQQVATRNTVAAQLTTLDSALDTRLTTQSTQ